MLGFLKGLLLFALCVATIHVTNLHYMDWLLFNMIAGCLGCLGGGAGEVQDGAVGQARHDEEVGSTTET
jgi:hypothetical protein